MKPIKNVTIIGMGALGTLFGYEIQSKIGRENVAFLMDEARCEKNKTAVYKVNGEPFDFRIISPKEAAPADLIIVSTKATGLTEALDTMAPAVGDETIIISAINGVVSEEILADRFGAFLRENLPVNPVKCEYFLPFVVDSLLKEGKATVQVLPTPDKWYGMTYKEDRDMVVDALAGLRAGGKYPDLA